MENENLASLNAAKRTVAIDVIVIFHINGFKQKPPMRFKVYEVPDIGEVIMPFLQSYKYKVKFVDGNSNVFDIHLEPFCDSAKKVFESQYGQYGYIVT